MRSKYVQWGCASAGSPTRRCRDSWEGKEDSGASYVHDLLRNARTRYAKTVVKRWPWQQSSNLVISSPQTQVTFTSPLDGREIRGDFCWERDDGSLVVGELDGRRKYTDPAMTNGAEISEVIMREKDRESELNMLQIPVVRFQMEHVRKREPLRQRLEASRIPHDSNVWRSPFAGFRCVAY